MTVSPADLRRIPLFQAISDEHLHALMAAFERQQLPEGHVLFSAGDQPAHLLLLIEGEVALEQDSVTRFRLHPIAPIGELGALTGLIRNTTAQCTTTSEVWRISSANLTRFFEERGDVAFPFHHNLLQIAADKIRRDTRRIDEMRSNIIRTQKAMKQVREFILQSEDTPVCSHVYETMEQLIEQNRRWHYLVEPAHTLNASVRLDGGTIVNVVEMSDHWLKIAAPSLDQKPGDHWSAVLLLPQGELPVSGTIESEDTEGLLVRLDGFIEQYTAMIEDFLTRLHMLDFVV